MDHQAFAQLLGNYGEFVGAVAVVATLIYLTIQIRQNNLMLRRQAHMDRNASITSPFLEPGSRLLGVYAKLNTADGTVEPITSDLMSRYELDLEEAVLWARYLHQILLGFEADFLFVGRSVQLEKIIDVLFRFPNFQLFWEHEREWVFDSSFVAYVDALAQGQRLAPGIASGERIID
jgi:hypothetical protein